MEAPDSAAASEDAERAGTVIHVAFGARGGRVTEPSGVASAVPSVPPPAEVREPVTDLFTRREVAKLLGVSEARLRSLDRVGDRLALGAAR